MQLAISLILYEMLHIKYLYKLSSLVFGAFYTISPDYQVLMKLFLCCPLLFFPLRRLTFYIFTNRFVSHN